ncbi:MAG: hypothetical protein LBD22_06695 [Spirochaetaceae bacterium]|nr:hypothetical protein [Spirochaetaceae bacterium]
MMLLSTGTLFAINNDMPFDDSVAQVKNKPPPLPPQEGEKIKAIRYLSVSATTIPEVMLSLTHEWDVPVLRGNTPFTKDNNIKPLLRFDFMPVGIDITAEATLTPIAFLQVIAGLKIGSGWSLGKGYWGIGISSADERGRLIVDSHPFSGIITKQWLGGALQADLAALIPGKWTHIVFRTYHEIGNTWFSAAKMNESWYHANDEGENRNGFTYLGSYLLGYRMPIFLNTIGFRADVNTYLYDLAQDTLWGDDLPRWIFSVFANFDIFDSFEVTAVCQFWSQRNYTDPSWQSLYYRNRHIDPNNKLSASFYRLACIITWHF